MILNYKRAEYFKIRYKRDPKVWTIEDIHALWLKAKYRSDSRRKVTYDFIENKIVKDIPANEIGQHIIYFYIGDHITSCYFEFNKEWKSYSSSTRTVELKTRDEKLTFILANEKAFDYGAKYQELKKLETDLHWRIYNQLHSEVTERLNNHFVKNDTRPPKVFSVTIADHKYYVVCDDPYFYKGCCKFSLYEDQPLVFVPLNG